MVNPPFFGIVRRATSPALRATSPTKGGNGSHHRAMSVSLEKQIKDRHGYVAVFLYMIYQGPSFL